MEMEVLYNVDIDGNRELERLGAEMFDAISGMDQVEFRSAAARWVDAVARYMDEKAEEYERLAAIDRRVDQQVHHALEAADMVVGKFRSK